MGLSTLTRSQLRQRVAGTTGLRGLLTGTATSGVATQDTTTLVDASLLKDAAYPANRFDPGGYLGIWGGATSTAYESHKILSGSSGHQPSTGAVNVGRTFTTTPVSAVTPWEVHTHGFSPDEIHDALNWACRSAIRPVHWLLTGLLEGSDGGMEDSGTTNWTGTSATVTKTTTEANVGFGERSLSVANSGADGYAASAAVPVFESQGFLVFGFVKVTTGVASIVVRDRTNGAAISVAWALASSVDAADGSDWRYLIGSFTTPSGCVSLELRLSNTSAAGVSYWDDVGLYPQNARSLNLPTWLADPNADTYDLLHLTQYSAGRRDGDLTKIRPLYSAAGNPTGQTAWTQPVPPTALVSPVVLLAARGFAELSADSSTVPDWAGDWLTAGALYQLYQAGARPRGLDAAAFAAERARIERQWWNVCWVNHPQHRYGRPVRTRL